MHEHECVLLDSGDGGVMGLLQLIVIPAQYRQTAGTVAIGFVPF